MTKILALVQAEAQLWTGAWNVLSVQVKSVLAPNSRGRCNMAHVPVWDLLLFFCEFSEESLDSEAFVSSSAVGGGAGT